jgi:excisionase family DNA binding protein
MKNQDLDLLQIYEQLERIERASLAQKKALTFKEACSYTNFSESYMYKLTSGGIVPYSKPNGKTIFFDREKLDHWMLSKMSTSHPDKEAAAATYIATQNR